MKQEEIEKTGANIKEVLPANTTLENDDTMNDEPILKEDPSRFVLFPIKHDDIWNFYKKFHKIL